MTIEPRTDARAEAGPAIPICAKCLGEVLPWMDFCMRCRSPLTAFANTGPMESAFSEGWGIGEAIVTKRPSLVSVIGLWFLLVPTMLGFGVSFAFSLRESHTWLGAVGRLVAAGVIACLAWALFHATRNYVRARRRRSEPEVG